MLTSFISLITLIITFTITLLMLSVGTYLFISRWNMGNKTLITLITLITLHDNPQFVHDPSRGEPASLSHEYLYVIFILMITLLTLCSRYVWSRAGPDMCQVVQVDHLANLHVLSP